jgi:BTB/POZ domain
LVNHTIFCQMATISWFPVHRLFYTLTIDRCDLRVDEKLNFNFHHLAKKTNDDVQAIAIIDSKLSKIPSQLSQLFKNVKILCIKQCTIDEISQYDLATFENLTELWMPNNRLTYLPENLFDSNRCIERMSFSSNRIKLIGAKVLEPLKHLKFANFKRNPAINAVYDADKSDMPLEALKLLIRTSCQDPKAKVSQQTQTSDSTFISDINRFLYREEFKDFEIKGQKRTFNVHKFIMAARSPTIRSVLLDTPGMKGISVPLGGDESIEIILDYIYEDQLPVLDSVKDMLVCFDLAVKFNLTDLVKYAEGQISNVLSDENVVDVLEMAIKHDSKVLKLASCDFIKVMFPGKTFQPAVLDDSTKMAKFVEELKVLRKSIEDARMRFNEMSFFEK